MTSGETLLKITDFPFSYTVIAITFVVLDINFDDKKIIILLAIAGSLGTLLSVTNPVGRLLKYWLKGNIENGRQKKYSILFSKIPYSLRAVETRAIGIEIDKLVSIWYFASIMILVGTLFVYSPTFIDKLELETNDGSTFCDKSCVQLVGVSVSSTVSVILGIVATRDWKNVIKFLNTAAIHQSAINSKNADRSTIENLNKAIELNDWPTAEEWAAKTEEEISEQKGRKDSILELVKTVYQPLFQEILELLKKHDEIIKSQWYSELPNEVWAEIRSSERYFVINDEKFVRMMDDFQNLVNEFNDLVKYAHDKANKIINKEASNFYQKDVTQVNYVYRTKEGHQSSPTLANCLIHDIHPRDDKRVKSNPILHIQLGISENGASKSITLETKQDFKDFDKLWKKMILVFNNDLKCKKMKDDFLEINLQKDTILYTIIDKLKQQKMFY